MMDKDYLYQIDIREWIERGLDADIMVPVSGNKIDKSMIYTFRVFFFL